MPEYPPYAVQQQMGWLPVPADDGSAALPQPGGEFPLHPAVLQGLGLPPLQAQAEPPPQWQAPAPEVAPAVEQPAPPQPRPAEYVVPSKLAEEPVQQPQAKPRPVQQPQQPQPTSPAGQLVAAQIKQAQASQVGEQAVKMAADAELAKNAEVNRGVDAHQANAAAIEQQQRDQAADAAKVRATKQAFVEATMKQADSHTVDNNRFRKQMGAGGMIGWGIAMILSSVGEAMQGKKGPNPILEMLQQKMNADVQQQLDERDQLRAKGSRAAHDLDKYDAFSKDRAAQTALLQAQNDKRLADMIQLAALKTADQATIAKAADKIYSLRQSQADKEQKAAEYASKDEIDRKQLGVSQYNAATTRLNHGETVRHNMATEDLTAQQRDIAAAALLKAGKNDEAKLVRERALGGEAKPVRDPVTNKVTGYEIGLITNKDGSVFVPKGTETSVTKLQEQHNIKVQYIGTLQEIARLGPEWMSETANTEKLQRLKQLAASARMQAIRLNQLGVPTGRDIELADGFVGTDDVARFKSSVHGLSESLKTTIRDHQVELETAGLDKKWEPPTNTGNQPDAPPSSEEQIQTLLKAKPFSNYDEAFRDAQVYHYKQNPNDLAGATRAARAEALEYQKVAPKQRRAIEDLTQRALAGDAAAQKSLGATAEAKETSPEVKRLLGVAISKVAADARTRQEGTGKYQVRSDTGVTRDYSPYDPNPVPASISPWSLPIPGVTIPGP